VAETARSERRAERRTSSSPVPPPQRTVSIAAVERRAATRRPVAGPTPRGQAGSWRDVHGGPTARLVTVVLATALGIGTATGLGAGLQGPTVDPLTLTGSTDAASASASPATASAGPKVAVAVSTPSGSRGPAPSPDKASFVTTPWSRNYDFAVVKGVQQGSDQVVTLTVDRLTFYTGAEATAYYKAHPALPQADYAIVNQSQRLYTFALVAGAPLFGSTVLAGTVAAQPVTGPQLLTRTKAALTAGRPVYVWLHHDDHDLAWTTYLAEQYLP
jgi:hypothetical protein